MTIENQPVSPSSFLSFLQKRKVWREVTGYHVGDIHEVDTPVLLTEGSTVVGNVFAPQVVVAGLLCGSIITNEAYIKKRGQIWGDLLTVSLSIDNGGKIQGWVSTIEAETAEQWIEQGHFPEDKTTDHLPAIPKELLKNFPDNKGESDIDAFHILQAETAAALAARAEIERRFEDRIDEVAGGAAEKIESLSGQLSELEEKKRASQKMLDALQEQLSEREAQLEHHQSELALTRQKISDLQTSNDRLKSEFTTLNERHTVLAHDKQILEENLTEARQSIERLRRRLKSGEEALKGSLQHSSELQDSLERWQELAEANEKEAEAFQMQLAEVQFQHDENEKLLELMREQKKKAEDEWLQLKSEHDALLVQTGATTDQTATELFIDEASQRMAQLENTLLDLIQQQQEEIRWFTLNLQHQAAQIGEFERALFQKESESATLAAETEQLYKLTSEQLTEIKRLTDLLNQSAEEHKTQIDAMKKELEKANNRVEATEADLHYHIDAIARQGQHLAEIQTRLSEREVQLKQAGQVIKQQKAVFQAYQEKAAARIEELQSMRKATNRTSQSQEER